MHRAESANHNVRGANKQFFQAGTVVQTMTGVRKNADSNIKSLFWQKALDRTRKWCYTNIMLCIAHAQYDFDRKRGVTDDQIFHSRKPCIRAVDGF